MFVLVTKEVKRLTMQVFVQIIHVNDISASDNVRFPPLKLKSIWPL